MRTARLTRTVTRADHGTFGALVLDSAPFCVTLEPYHKEVHGLVPAGQYMGVPYRSPQFGDVYLLKDVAGRSMIELHPGNRDDNTKGCILLAQYYGKLWGDLAVLNSGNTFKEFLRRVAGDTLFLTIQEAY